MRLRARDFTHQVVLVPDVEAYKLFQKLAMPGVEKDLVLSGWNMLETSFNFRNRSYDANFGLGESADITGPELYYNVDLRREFLQAFIINLVPFFVIATLLFATLVHTTTRKKRASLFGISPMSVLAASSGLLFTALLGHTKLRQDLTAETGIIYLECFYFAIYLMLLLVPLQSSMHAFGVRVGLLQYGDAILAKVLYWPFLLGMLLIMTVWVVQ
ncbi:MAG: hypothetical protein FJX76_09955 [Armatimonadetes bacterium]|nr:hypothetical protein [Armatimonadota bacterium]